MVRTIEAPREAIRNGNRNGTYRPIQLKTLNEGPIKRVNAVIGATQVSESTIKRNLRVCGMCTVKHKCDISFLEPGWERAFATYREHEYKAGQTIGHSGQFASGVTIICKGKARVYKATRLGEHSILRIARPGNMIHDIDFLAGDRSREWGKGRQWEDSEAIEPTRVAHIEGSVFAELVRNNPRLSYKKMTQLARSARDRGKKIVSVAYDPAFDKLVEAFVTIAFLKKHTIEKLMKKEGKLLEVRIENKRVDIAMTAHLTIETTVRLMAKMETDGYIRRELGCVVLLRPFFEKLVPKLHLKYS